METLDIPLDGVTIYVTSNVNTIVHEEWSDSLFRAKSLFMDLERIKSVELDLRVHKEIPIMGATKAALETVLQTRIEEIGKDNPQALLFGAVKVPRTDPKDETTGPLKPLSSTNSVSVNRDGENYIGGALNYLLLNKNLSKVKQGQAAGIFDHTLIRDGAKGTLVTSDATLLQSYVKPALVKQWGMLIFALTGGFLAVVQPNCPWPATMHLA